jgi:hypothetical protein
VKPLSQIKELYVVPALSDAAFSAVPDDDDCDLG